MYGSWPKIRTLTLILRGKGDDPARKKAAEKATEKGRAREERARKT
jgi:hypothetical protein